MFHALQSQAAHAGVSVRLSRKIDALEGRSPAQAKGWQVELLSLFPDDAAVARDVHLDITTPEPIACGLTARARRLGKSPAAREGPGFLLCEPMERL